jgi:hypothetical protein
MDRRPREMPSSASYRRIAGQANFALIWAHGSIFIQNRTMRNKNQQQNDLGRIPILIVGCKLDVEDRKKPRYDEIYNTVKTMGIDNVFLSSVRDHPFNNQPVLDFIDQVIKGRYYTDREQSVTPLHNRRVQDRNQIVVNFGPRIDPANNVTHPFGLKPNYLS